MERRPSVRGVWVLHLSRDKGRCERDVLRDACFADRTARDSPFTEADAAAVHLLARAAGQLLTRRAHQQSQPTPTQLAPLFEHSPHMINIHDGKGNLIASNPRLCEKTGYREDELTGMKVWELDRDVTQREAQVIWARMNPGDQKRWEGTYQCKDGSALPVEVDLRRIDVEDTPRFIANCRDITEQRRMMERLLEVQEEERRRIDQEIHDEMGGLLTSIQLALSLARRTAQDAGAPTEQFEELQGLVDDLATVSRTISRKLYPSALSMHGLGRHSAPSWMRSRAIEPSISTSTANLTRTTAFRFSSSGPCTGLYRRSCLPSAAATTPIPYRSTSAKGENGCICMSSTKE